MLYILISIRPVLCTSKRLDSNMDSKSLNNTYLNIIEILFLLLFLHTVWIQDLKVKVKLNIFDSFASFLKTVKKFLGVQHSNTGGNIQHLKLS